MAKIYDRFVELVKRIPTIDNIDYLFYSVIKETLSDEDVIELVSHLKEVFLDGKESLHYNIPVPSLGKEEVETSRIPTMEELING